MARDVSAQLHHVNNKGDFIYTYTYIHIHTLICLLPMLFRQVFRVLRRSVQYVHVAI